MRCTCGRSTMDPPTTGEVSATRTLAKRANSRTVKRAQDRMGRAAVARSEQELAVCELQLHRECPATITREGRTYTATSHRVCFQHASSECRGTAILPWQLGRAEQGRKLLDAS